ncbi:uncharacterized protein LOC120670645 isoform X1 [Panicum virgatum]|uniref:uncharacterized protein LOC120670645 isoform X1 n=1 Tax=Panicum virgatum TaxID=38727 RepID=UPI0019D5116B|nr:uncharacterized protein LOC120670645 isoform X1 [Panicum virgatum]
MLLVASTAASRPLPLLARSGGRGAPPCIRTARREALTALQLRSSSSTLSCACSPSPSPAPSPGDGGKGSARHLFDVTSLIARSVAIQEKNLLPFPPSILKCDFSILSPVVPWEPDDIWRIYAGYFFVLHIPLSFGGLGAVAKVLKCSSLDPMTTVISTVLLQLVELSLALALLQYTAMAGNDVQAFFASKVSTRNWIKETIIGFTVLMILVWITSILADKLVGSEDAYDPILKGILSDSPTSKLLCFFLYCVIAPLSEETIYRGFLLTALSSSMKWRDAVVMSSLAFSVAHLSGESFVQLFVIGCITGLTYCRTGTLVASFTIHSLYNAVTLYMALAS